MTYYRTFADPSEEEDNRDNFDENLDIDFKELRITGFDGVDPKDYPDFCDAYASEAEYRGFALNDDELDYLNDTHGDIVYEALLESLN